jgi:hypothetical protein
MPDRTAVDVFAGLVLIGPIKAQPMDGGKLPRRLGSKGRRRIVDVEKSRAALNQ